MVWDWLLQSVMAAVSSTSGDPVTHFCVTHTRPPLTQPGLYHTGPNDPPTRVLHSSTLAPTTLFLTHPLPCCRPLLWPLGTGVVPPPAAAVTSRCTMWRGAPQTPKVRDPTPVSAGGEGRGCKRAIVMPSVTRIWKQRYGREIKAERLRQQDYVSEMWVLNRRKEKVSVCVTRNDIVFGAIIAKIK